MRWRPLIYLVLSLAAVAGVFAAAPAPAPPANPNEPIATQTPEFSIPIIWPKSAVAVEVRVSADQGATWQLNSKLKPDRASFAFRAPHDGEYWFALRTLDKQGRARPDGPPLPEVKVLVDTVPPRLDLLARRGAGGEIVIDWRAVDPLLKPDTLRVEVQPEPAAMWETVAINQPVLAMPGMAPPANYPRHTLKGQATYMPKPGKGQISVRAQVSDSAGNVASIQVRPKTEAELRSDKEKSDKEKAAQLAAKAADPSRIDLKLGVAAGAGTGLAAGAGSAAQPVSRNPFDRGGAVNRAWPADNATIDPLPRSDRPSVSPDSRGQSSADTDWRATGVANPLASQGTPVRNASTSARVEGGGLTGAGNQGNGSGKTLNMNLLPPGERPRMVNARSFDLEYEIDSVGTSGIAKVELWGTRDGGRTWSSFGLDPDNRSPIRVNVDGEGIYGFRIIVESGSGLGGLPPRDGDLPEIWVGVDLTRPAAKITTATIQPDTGELQIRWEASDELPDPRPISLAFSDHANGPWTPIASGLENTGSYSWRLDNRAPDKIYLRLEARDEAGNVGVFVSKEPVLLDRQRPQGRIRGIRPAGEAARPTK